MLDKYFELLRKHPELFVSDNAPLKIVKNKDIILTFQNSKKKSLHDNGLPEDWAKIGILLDDPFVTVIRDLVEFPNGHKVGYLRVISRSELSGAMGVIMLPIYKNKILLIKQFRHSTRRWHWEVPRGYGEIGSSSAQNVKIEIREEIGGEISEIIPLGSLYPETGLEQQCVELFLCKLTSIGSPAINEGISKFVLFPIKDLEEAIRNDLINDSFTIACYTRAKLRGFI